MGEPLKSDRASIHQAAKPSRRPDLIQFELCGWRFSASLMPILTVLFAFPVLLSLGFWQLDRAEQKEILQQRFSQQLEMPAEPVSASELTTSTERYIKVLMKGELLAGEQQFLLDNRVFKGQAGYEVLLPLRVETGEVILLNRGWLPVGDSRELKPSVGVDSQLIEVAGIAAIPPQRFSLGEALLSEDGWPKVLQFEDFSAIQQALGSELVVIPRILQPLDDAFWRFEPIWRAVEKGPAQNYGYAFQWFSLAVALVAIVVFVCVRRTSTSFSS